MNAGMNESRERIIGVDFDNTLVTYDGLLYNIAVQHGLIPPTTEKNKKCIRDHIRQLPTGEIEWQKLQALAYGPRIGEARLIDGVWTFFKLCKQNGVKVYIVSHKTEFANYDETHTNLRTAALDWMAANKFFKKEGLGLSTEVVFFGAIRQEKIELVRMLGCTHFIDDLEETFLEETFPANVEKILFAPYRQPETLPGVKVLRAWQEINDYFFSGTD
jgi:hypothetical protein